MRRLLVILLLFAAGMAWAGMYKWVDDAGGVHYSQTPPPDREASTVKPPPPPAEPPDTARGQLHDQVQTNVDDYLEDRELAAKKRQQEEERKARYAKNCQIARNNLANLQNAAIRRIRMPDGSYALPDEEQRQQMLEEAHQAIGKYCK